MLYLDVCCRSPLNSAFALVSLFFSIILVSHIAHSSAHMQENMPKTRYSTTQPQARHAPSDDTPAARHGGIATRKEKEKAYEFVCLALTYYQDRLASPSRLCVDNELMN